MLKNILILPLLLPAVVSANVNSPELSQQKKLRLNCVVSEQRYEKGAVGAIPETVAAAVIKDVSSDCLSNLGSGEGSVSSNTCEFRVETPLNSMRNSHTNPARAKIHISTYVSWSEDMSPSSITVAARFYVNNEQYIFQEQKERLTPNLRSLEIKPVEFRSANEGLEFDCSLK